MPTKSILTLSCALFLSLAGCNDTPKPPVGAMRPPDHAPVTPHTGVWTKQDKIDAINKSGMSADMKKSAIQQINSGG